MGSKSPVITVRKSLSNQTAAPAVISNYSAAMEQSNLFSNATTSTTCDHCKTIFANQFDLIDHVASCARGSTEELDSDSSLTPPPESPPDTSRPPQSQTFQNIEEVPEEVTENVLAPQTDKVDDYDDHDDDSVDDDTNVKQPEVDNAIQAYVNVPNEFDYYDKVDQQESSAVTRRNSEELGTPKSTNPDGPETSSDEKSDIRYPFPKFTQIGAFLTYIGNPQDMDYDEVYRRADMITNVLRDYQMEYDAIDKEIYAEEHYVKAEVKRAAENAKVLEEEKLRASDREYLSIQQKYKKYLELNKNEWEKFINYYENWSRSPAQQDLISRLIDLRDENIVAAIQKREKAREPQVPKLIGAAWPEDKPSKGELADARKGVRLLEDPIKFDDKKQADIYGFNYSAHPNHYGNQPLPSLATKAATEESRGGRSQRTKSKRNYDDIDRSISPETPVEELPEKRIRKKRTFDASIESATGPQSVAHSRVHTPPPVKTFASGKRVGRPPKPRPMAGPLPILPAMKPGPSSLKNIQSAAQPQAQTLAPMQEEQLQNAARSLVDQVKPLTNGEGSNKFHGYIPRSSGETPKRGKNSISKAENSKGTTEFVIQRPKGFKPSGESFRSTGESSMNTSESSSRPTTSSSIRSKRKRGDDMELDTLVVDATSTDPTPSEPTPRMPKFKKKRPEMPNPDDIEDPAERELAQKRLIKSNKLSESMKARWANGAMATAMQNRKNTNEKKKALKAGLASLNGVPIASASQAPFQQPFQPPNVTPKGPKPAKQPSISQFVPPVLAPATIPTHQVLTPSPQLPSTPLEKAAASSTKKSSRSSSSTKTKKVPPPLRQSSGRVPKKPSRFGSDGIADDYEDDDEVSRQFRSEYDRYQALTSPGSPVLLGKRVRKNKIDLAEALEDGEEDSEDYWFEK